MPAANKKAPPKTNSTKSEATNKKKPQPADSQPAAQAPISWPTLDPQCPREDLSITHLVPGQIVTIPRFWTATLCKKYVSFLSSLPLSTTPGVPKRGDAVRVNDRFQVDDPSFAEMLWSGTALRDLVGSSGEDGAAPSDAERRTLWGGEVVGLNPNIRIYRYRKGQFFDQHYDGSNVLTHPGPPSTPSRTTWTLLLYLTSPATGCTGGETVFYPEASGGSGKNKSKQREQPEPVVVGLETGMALLHRHGRECMLHEGREVTEGEKWVIRSDLCVKR